MFVCPPAPCLQVGFGMITDIKEAKEGGLVAAQQCRAGGDGLGGDQHNGWGESRASRKHKGGGQQHHV